VHDLVVQDINVRFTNSVCSCWKYSPEPTINYLRLEPLGEVRGEKSM